MQGVAIVPVVTSLNMQPPAGFDGSVAACIGLGSRSCHLVQDMVGVSLPRGLRELIDQRHDAGESRGRSRSPSNAQEIIFGSVQAA